MDTRFSEIKILVWDFDGTLYQPNRNLWQEIREAEYQVILNHTNWTKEKVIEEFEKLHKKVIPSATETVAKLSQITTMDAALEMERFFDRRNYLRKDEQLILLFKKLKLFRHFILANGVKHRIEEVLATLGIPEHTFEMIVTSEKVGANKPSEIGYRYILDETKLPASDHLMIGDRVDIDLVPAKNIGLKTCYIFWKTPPSEKEEESADICIPTVYDIEKILL